MVESLMPLSRCLYAWGILMPAIFKHVLMPWTADIQSVNVIFYLTLLCQSSVTMTLTYR